MQPETKYDFTTILQRKGHDASAYDSVGVRRWGFEPAAPKDGFDFIPMWVADMNFATCPTVTDALVSRAKEPTFGYFNISDDYYDAIIRWQKTRHGATELTRESIGYENGVHGLVSTAIDLFTQPGDGIFLHTPYYVGFIGDIRGKGRRAVFSALKKDRSGIYRMDYEDMDRKIRENNVHFAIFCSPHNPCGRVWTREELAQAMTVFEKNDCIVVSDEIWSDIIFGGHAHIPVQLTNPWAKDHVIAAYAPSKTFNLAGLVGSYHVIYNKMLRDRVDAFSEKTHYNEMNVFSMHALTAAYSAEGSAWTDELCAVLEENARFAVDFIRGHFRGVNVSMPDGTYMLFLDCAEFCQMKGWSTDDLLRAGWDKGIGWQDGRAFGKKYHIRLNLASPRSMIEEAFDRMRKYIFTL